jgi:hypothetical protein
LRNVGAYISLLIQQNFPSGCKIRKGSAPRK